MTALTDRSFAAFETAHRFALVHFGATWNRYDDQMAIGTLDTDQPEHHDLCRSHHVENLPFLAPYRDGVLFTTVTGVHRAGKSS